MVFTQAPFVPLVQPCCHAAKPIGCLLLDDVVLYLSESWRVNKDTSSNCFQSSLGIYQERVWTQRWLTVETKTKKTPWWRTFGRAATEKCVSAEHSRDSQEETDRRRAARKNDRFIFLLHAKNKRSHRQLRTLSDLLVWTRLRHFSHALILRLGTFVLCLTSVSHLVCPLAGEWGSGEVVGSGGGRVVRVVALRAAEFLQRQFCREETGNWFSDTAEPLRTRKQTGLNLGGKVCVCVEMYSQWFCTFHQACGLNCGNTRWSQKGTRKENNTKRHFELLGFENQCLTDWLCFNQSSWSQREIARSDLTQTKGH